jgi:hypothetical protein
MNEAGKIEHQMYRQWRSQDVQKLSPAEKTSKRKADTAAADLYFDAWESYLKRTGQKEDNIKQIINRTRQVFSNEG